MTRTGSCGVVLAAGAGTRFGGAKQLAELDGRPLVQHAVDVAGAAASLDRVVVVLGAHADEVQAQLQPGRAQVVRCTDWDEGMAASLRCGFDAATGADWIVVLLADEPRMPIAAIERVVGAARAAPGDVLAARATWLGRPGHPVVLSARLGPRVAELRGDRGAREIVDSVAALELECGDLGEPRDIDTREQLDEAARG